MQKYTKKDSRENNRQSAPYTLFSSNKISMKKIIVGMHIVCYFPYYPCLHTFWHHVTIPTYLAIFNLLVSTTFYTDFDEHQRSITVEGCGH